MAGGAWIRTGDDCATECEASGVVSENPAGGEGGTAGAVDEGKGGMSDDREARDEGKKMH